MSVVASRPTLRATPAISRTVAGRVALARLDAVRARLDADPGHGQTEAFRRAERHVHDGRLPQAGDALLEIERVLDGRAEATLVSKGLAETVALNAGRGEEQEGHGTGEVRLLGRDGLLWLKSKKRMTGAPLLAAEMYRKHHTTVHSGDVRIARPDRIGGGAAGDFSPAQAKVDAIKAIRDAHEIGLSRDGGLILVVEAVCGRGETLMDLANGDKHAAARLEAELQVACRLLARHFKIG